VSDAFSLVFAGFVVVVGISMCVVQALAMYREWRE
jgi:hypothetical protein